MKRALHFKAAPGIFVLGALALLAHASVAAETHRVRIVDMKFVPETLTIHAGDTVEWTNEDLVPHTVTEEAKKPKLDSGMINGSARFNSQFKKPGEIPYFCRFHPLMKGKIQVR